MIPVLCSWHDANGFQHVRTVATFADVREAVEYARDRNLDVASEQYGRSYWASFISGAPGNA